MTNSSYEPDQRLREVLEAAVARGDESAKSTLIAIAALGLFEYLNATRAPATALEMLAELCIAAGVNQGDTDALTKAVAADNSEKLHPPRSA